MGRPYLRNTLVAYNDIAEEYAAHLYHELDHKPFDRKMLDWLVERVDGLGPICDLGCGPGQVARYICDHGGQAVGVDLSEAMITVARRLNPDITFIEGNMLALDDPDATFGGIAAFYSIIHIPRHRVVAALRELKRVLRPGGWLLLTYHIGLETLHADEMWGKPVSLDFIFFETREMLDFLKEAGFQVVEALERYPYPDVEYQSRRAYIFARKEG